MTTQQIRQLLNTHGVKNDHLTDTQVQQMTNILAFANIHPPKTPNQIHAKNAQRDIFYWDDRLR